jgi:broad specificity phosphatase PhoE
MMGRSLAVAVVLAAVSWPSAARAQRAVFLVRHAEKKDAPADALSDRGRLRADALALRLMDAGVSAVYTTQFVRTQQTAQPLKDALAGAGAAAKEESVPLPGPLLASPTDPSLLEAYARSVVGHLRANHADDIVLIVGHDVTVPAILKALGHPAPATIAPTEFDRLFVVIPRAAGDSRPPGLVSERY